MKKGKCVFKGLKQLMHIYQDYSENTKILRLILFMYYNMKHHRADLVTLCYFQQQDQFLDGAFTYIIILFLLIDARLIVLFIRSIFTSHDMLLDDL